MARQDLQARDVVLAQRQVHEVVAGLGIAHVETVQQHLHLVEGGAADGQVGLDAVLLALADHHAGHHLQGFGGRPARAGAPARGSSSTLTVRTSPGRAAGTREPRTSRARPARGYRPPRPRNRARARAVVSGRRPRQHRLGSGRHRKQKSRAASDGRPLETSDLSNMDRSLSVLGLGLGLAFHSRRARTKPIRASGIMAMGQAFQLAGSVAGADDVARGVQLLLGQDERVGQATSRRCQGRRSRR